MGIVASPAVFQDVRSMLVRFDEGFLVVTVETPSLEPESAASAQSVTVGAICGNRRMLLEETKGCRRILSHKESDFATPSLPDQPQQVFSRSGSQLGVEDVGERLLGRDPLTVQLQSPLRTGRHDADLF